VYPLRSHKCDNGAEPRFRIIAISAMKGLKTSEQDIDGEEITVMLRLKREEDG
jgi:hypothetical protein